MSYKFNPFSRKPDYYETGTTGSVDDVARDNIVNLAWRLAIAESLTVFNLEDGVVDEFEDETGIDTGASTNEQYDSTGDYYAPAVGSEVDNMEYASDVAAQAAYVTNGTYTSDLLSSGTASADNVALGAAANACDDNDSTYWVTGDVAYPHWWKYDFGSGVTKRIQQITLYEDATLGGWRMKDFSVQGSNNDSDWTTIYSGQHANNTNVQTFQFSNQNLYRYYRIYFPGPNWDGGNSYCGANEITMSELSLQAYSESTIKTQGSYSLKGVATTDALNKTLTRDLASAIDLSGVSWVQIDLRSDRASNNITFGWQQSISVSASLTPSLTSAGSFERFIWSLDAISDGAKNSISALYITLINADASNTFYVDGWTGPLLNMTLISESTEAEEQPTEARLLALVEPVDAITVNTDIKGYVSEDDGSNYDQVTLTDEGYFDSTKKILAGNVTLTDRSDQTMVQKLVTDNNKDLKVHAWGLLWS